ncbi:heterokaryon incompatibility protein-domain-containing protein, partial [Dactylonectria macrodidyma]
MRLINARTLKLEVFNDPVPTPYAILSHTWDGDEVSFEDMKDLNTARKKTASFSKIEATCRLVLGEGLDYVWVDTCCIDKSSSAELSEAINSMFRWYKNAIYCLAFLSDFSSGHDLIGASAAARKCRWFSRGWTLQELIAPAVVRFYNADWNFLGTKYGSAKEIETITGIDQGVLKSHTHLAAISLAKRMSWAATRRTTRIEDMAYCLLGVFDVTMPMLYGEGPRAFARLQEEILRKTTDLSLFAWRASEDSEYCSVLAKSPAEFFGCGTIDLNYDQFSFRDEISITNKGVKIHTPLQSIVSEDGIFFMDLHCYEETDGEHRNIGIYLKRELDT